MADTAPTTASPSGEIARRTETITTPTQFEAAIAKWTGNYNLLTPFTQITGLAPKHGIIASVVKINPDPAKGGPGDVYDGLPFLDKQKGEVALAKIGLRKIAEGAGISITTQRTDPRTIANLWEFKAIATYRGIDGTVVTREATAEWDLRDGSPRLKGWRPDQVSEGRKNGLRNAETRAINAAIREFGIKQKYTQQELTKPFLVIRVAWQPDPNNRDDMRLVGENALRGTSTLYGGAALPAPAHAGDVLDGDVVDDEPRHVGSGRSAEPAAGKTEPAKAAEPAKANADTPPSADAVRVEKVDSKDGETKGRKWTRYTITDSRGEECSTFDKTVAEAATKAGATKSWVELVCETRGEYRNLIEIIPAGSEPKLPDMGNL
jgi:hypothetical protein